MPIDLRKHTFRSPKFASVVRQAIQFLNGTPLQALPPTNRFEGVLNYALYYVGDFEHYTHIAQANTDTCAQPIYVGKAVPPGWRSARTATSDSATLYGRLREHARSIKQGRGLKSDDFRCRFMILDGVETDLVAAVEAQLIRDYSPFWNTVVDGFGNHDPGKGRYNQARSEWDVLHPGRPWAERLTGDSPALQDIITKIRRTR